MRFPILILAVAVAAACVETSNDDAADDVVFVDTVSIDDATPSPADDAGSPDDVSGGDDASDAADDAGDDDDAGAATTIPARFRGEWNADRSACGTGSSETRLRIGANEIRFYESVGVVRAVDVQSDRVVTVTAEYTGEGDTWQDDRRLTLSQDGGSLTVSGGGDLVRYRCP